ncbi:MAG: hypothetical protein A2283_05265 [Lentisphaerae bacterium RIFOXYA12_FULL_48_11]|nr:MAG: hypothetical protein A2283_05265 [Lentisphaerae bacterium RIFOXYA12_FULL_48_11]
MNRYTCHNNADQAKEDSAYEPAKNFYLSSSEGKAPVCGVAACQHKGTSGNRRCRSVRAHVPAVGKQGHGVKHPAGDDLDEYHGYSQQDNPHGFLFSLFPSVVEDVRMFVT